MLLTMLNEKPITAETKEVRVLIQAEKDFKPSRDLDLKSLRFGSSEEVNYGKGSKVVGTLQKGNQESCGGQCLYRCSHIFCDRTGLYGSVFRRKSFC